MLGPSLEGEVTRDLLFRTPPSPKQEEERLEQTAKSPDDVRWELLGRRTRFFDGEGHDEWLAEILREEWKG